MKMTSMKYGILTMSLMLSAIGYAQQTWQLSQYMSNMYLVNPATAGEDRALNLNGSFRQQWLGTQYAPRTFYISATSRIFSPSEPNATTMPTTSDFDKTNKKGKVKHAVGGIVLQDQFGAFSYTTFGGSYNLHVPLSRSWTLSTALKASVKNWIFDPSKTQVGNANDPKLAAFAASNQAFNDWIPSLDFGLYAYSRYLFFSYATDQLTQGNLQFENTNFSPALNMTHYGMIGGRIAVSQKTHIIPSTLIKYTAAAPASVDFNVKLDVQDRYFAAVGYRWNSDIILTGAVYVNDMLKIGYSFDYPIADTRSLGFGSHEIFLGLELFKK